MPDATPIQRAIAFFDGQNLYHAAKDAFGYTWANYDPVLLATAVCARHGWTLTETRFYTGIHTPWGNAYLNGFWKSKLAVLGRQPKVHIFTRSLRYRRKTINLPNGSTHTFTTAEEKGVDVRLALDLVRLAMRAQYDVALVFSQDQDLSEAADEVRAIATEQNRKIVTASAFPVSANSLNIRGINNTKWIPIDKVLYDTCIDHRDYRPKTAGGPNP